MSLLPAISLGTLMVFGVVWAALHDIAHGELDTRLEWSVLALTVPAFVLIRRAASKSLRPGEWTIWRVGTGLLVLLFDLGALSALLRPKFVADPVAGAVFLAASVPAFVLLMRR